MQKTLIVMILSEFLCLTVSAERTDFLTLVSPTLRNFLVAHPSALEALTHNETFTKRTLQLYYFYTDDESKPKASHDFISQSEAVFYIRENQKPPDEFLCLIYEFVNSENDEHFQELVHMARSGGITREAFVKEILEAEFKATKKIRDMLANFRFTKREISESDYYKKFKNSPDDYDEFIAYSQRLVSPHRDIVKEYEMKYDVLRTSKH